MKDSIDKVWAVLDDLIEVIRDGGKSGDEDRPLTPVSLRVVSGCGPSGAFLIGYAVGDIGRVVTLQRSSPGISEHG